MLRAIALDDNPAGLEVLTDFCQRLDFVALLNTFAQPKEALRYLRQFPVDVVFVALNAQTAAALHFRQQLPPEILVVFTSASPEHAAKAFELDATDYLLQPFTFERFRHVAQKVNRLHCLLHRPPLDSSESLYLRANYQLHKVELASILYVEAMDDYLKVQLQHDKSLVVRMTMKALLQRLPAKQFVRVHRSYIVALRHIASVRNHRIRIAGTEIPVGTCYETDFYAQCVS